MRPPPPGELPLLLKIRGDIYRAIRRFPGIHFRELQRKVGGGTGGLEYHLRYLMKHRLIMVERSGRRTRFFPLELDDHERAILALLRQKNVRRIIIKVLQDKEANHGALVRFLQISPSTVTWHLRKLLDAGILSVKEAGREKRYTVNDPERVTRVILAYRESFLDALVDRFVDAWEL